MASSSENKTETRVDHRGKYFPDEKDVVADAKGSVTVAGSHTVYFMRKPTDNQVETAQQEAVIVSGPDEA